MSTPLRISADKCEVKILGKWYTEKELTQAIKIYNAAKGELIKTKVD